MTEATPSLEIPAPESRSPLVRLRVRLAAPVDIASLAVLRIAFGLLVLAGTARYVASGWVDTLLVQPEFHFHFWGFSWIGVPPGWVIYSAQGALALLAVLVSLGLFYRVAVVGLVVLFGWLELLDVTTYLNHYYLVVLLAALLAVMPAHGAWSLDALRRPALRRRTTPAWTLWLLRFQVGAVYVFAGLAKANAEWLVHGQPLHLWLTARAETPLLGPLFGLFEVALLMSWLGCLHDLTMPFALSSRRLRPIAYPVLLVFHGVTGYLLNIGMFPFIMATMATSFFEPDWPRRAWARLAALRGGGEAATGERGAAGTQLGGAPPLGRLATAAIAGWCLIQLLVPLRAHLYESDVLWAEEGMRWSWRVVVREKNGSVTYRVRVPNKARELEVPAARYLSKHQEREFSGQPDLILQLAHRIGDDYAHRVGAPVEVRVDAVVSYNGRPPARLIDPEVDLAQVRDGLAAKPWILFAPETPPLRLGRPAPHLAEAGP